jgi:hypothetical protein
MAEQLFDGDLSAWLCEQREAGVSWDALFITLVRDKGIPVSRGTVRAWTLLAMENKKDADVSGPVQL